MREPNFSESQLQQAVNTAYIRRIHEQHGIWVFANVPSLIDEFDLGWDSAFYFPWLPHSPLVDHEGCNFFVQYKLSSELTSAGAKEWEHWGTQYFRFKIPHSTRDVSGQFVDDYHQWNHLKALANQNYPTFYATNSTLSKDLLRQASQAGTLLADIPLLDVRSVEALHKHVTFIQDSTFFLLHSEKEKASRGSFVTVMEKLAEQSTASLKVSAELLLRILKKIGRNDEMWNSDLSKITQAHRIRVPNRLLPLVTHLLISSFVRKHLGAEMLWFPKKG
jgi:hypothetical protein